MTGEKEIEEILSQYERFGWQLDHILLSRSLKSRLGVAALNAFSRKPIEESDLDAAWFSRPSPNGRVAWELRWLGPSPLALVDSERPNASGEELNELFQRVEAEMRRRIIRPDRTH